MPRDYSLDRIRVIVTAIVVFHHAAITYGAPGGWPYVELPFAASPTGLFFILFVSVNQAYFMGIFFFIAGYFTPASYHRKGPRKFLIDRFIRLGIPWAAFCIFNSPLCDAMMAHWAPASGPPKPLLHTYVQLMRIPHWDNGPLWFVQALLMFSLVYIAWRSFHTPAPPHPTPPPRPRTWFLTAIVTGAAALLIRQAVPVSTDVIGLQLGYFATYIVLFAVGILAGQRNWLAQLTWQTVRPSVIVSILLLPLMVILYVVAVRNGHPVVFATGFSAPAILYAFWEPLVAWGIVGAYLVWFRRYANRPSPAWHYLASTAYAVYVVHTPVLIATSLALRNWHGPAMAKFLTAGTLAFIASSALSAALLRIPFLHRVL